MRNWEELADYKEVGASQTKASLGPGSTQSNEPDILVAIIVIPLTTSPGQVKIHDGAGDAGFVVFQGGASSKADLSPSYIPIGPIRALNAAANASGPRWLITTGASVQIIAVGKFK